MFRTRQKKMKDDNPLHTEYGIISNSFYILGKIRRYCPFLLILMTTGVITSSLMPYLWSFIGKFVIDIMQVQADTPVKDIRPLLHLLIITTLLELVCMLLNTITDNKRWYHMIHVRMHIISERVEKCLSMDYQMLEQPKSLTCIKKQAPLQEEIIMVWKVSCIQSMILDFSSYSCLLPLWQ